MAQPTSEKKDKESFLYQEDDDSVQRAHVNRSPLPKAAFGTLACVWTFDDVPAANAGAIWITVEDTDVPESESRDSAAAMLGRIGR